MSDWAGLPLSHGGWLSTRGTRTQLLATGSGALHGEALARLRPAVMPKSP